MRSRSWNPRAFWALLLVAAAVAVGVVLVVSRDGAGGSSSDEASAPVPGPETTGHGELSTASGSLRITEPGSVVDGYDVTGTVVVEADDVTIRNTRIETAGTYGIVADEDVTGLLVEDVTIEGTGVGCSAGIAPDGSWTLRRSDISGCIDGIKVRSDQVVEANWVHDLRTGKLEDGNWAHNDGIQSTSGADVVIRGNNLEIDWQEGANAAVMLSSGQGPLADYTITGNRFAGGQYVVSIRDKGYGDPTGIEITDNVWVRDDWNFGPTNFEGSTVGLGPGNVYDDGSPL